MTEHMQKRQRCSELLDAGIETMVLGVLVSDGKKMPPFLFKAREKIDQNTYYKLLRYTILPWLKANYPEGVYLRSVKGSAPNIMANFWSTEMWPSSSPDLNPLDYAVWGTLKKETNTTSHPNVDSLKTAIVAEWDILSEEFIINSWKTSTSCAGCN
ncbi:Uncharacterized protein FKW44_013563 [Caligus rogercresseyi]|uniref:Transposable element Tc3 transposase n=1 Tax=Caligus rogercresseyi TaxID=217165 RepID=A0A7T8GYA1_CALRO|nr:Uncharacterized protein FKW44_013563 [Caligus rogercresseyi]